MDKRTRLNFVDEQAAIADLERLRRGNRPVGKWTLAQACWHCWVLAKDVLHSPGTIELTAEQSKSQQFIHDVNANGWPAPDLGAPPFSEPPPDAGPKAVEDLVSLLRKIEAYSPSHVSSDFFGPVATSAYRRFFLVHLAHHLSHFVPDIHRRPGLRYASLSAMIADIGRLRRGNTAGGNWSLAQICWHINLGFPMPLAEEVAQTELTEAQVARQQRWDYYIEHGHAPAGFEAPAEMIPPDTCSEADIDALIQRLHDLKAFKGTFIRAAAGVMPIERARGFILAHGALHLSCLHPTHRKREHLSFASEAGIIADIKRLQRGYSAGGNWTLSEVCWHLAHTIPFPAVIGDEHAPLTPAQEKMRPFLEHVLRNGTLPAGFEAPAELVPPGDCDETSIDELVRRLQAFAAFDAPFIAHPAFGPVAMSSYRPMMLAHCARHLAYLKPIEGPREGLRFADEDAAIADIQLLRKGYEQTGGWSLPQICWHLDKSMQFRMRDGPFEPNTPEQNARAHIFERVLASGELPRGIESPSVVVPPTDAGDEAVDGCIATFIKYKNFTGTFAPHRLFGHMPAEISHRQNLIHAAHHLSHLVPTTPTNQ